jgi:hypothetical protein
LNRLAPICFSLGNPTAARGQADIARARKRLKRAESAGEALMREYLTLLIDSQDYDDDEVARQQARVFMKASICRTRGIQVQVVTRRICPIHQSSRLPQGRYLFP